MWCRSLRILPRLTNFFPPVILNPNEVDNLKLHRRDILIIAITAVAVCVITVFSLLEISFTDDVTVNMLLLQTVPRFIAGGLLIAVTVLLGYKDIYIPKLKNLPKDLLWCIPCFAAVTVNFPFYALISGAARILRCDLIWLFVLECLSIALFEEVLFRALLYKTVFSLLKESHKRTVYAVIISSATFALIHIFNLFEGASFGATILQVGYSFLIGAMLAAVISKTGNLWICILLHCVFDIGGRIIADLGEGRGMDYVFWILTAVAGVICFIHIVYYLFGKNKKRLNS